MVEVELFREGQLLYLVKSFTDPTFKPLKHSF